MSLKADLRDKKDCYTKFAKINPREILLSQKFVHAKFYTFTVVEDEILKSNLQCIIDLRNTERKEMCINLSQ